MSDPERNRTSDLRFRKPESTDDSQCSPSEVAQNGSQQQEPPHKGDTTEGRRSLGVLSRKQALELLRSRVYFIYALEDPRDGLPRYVGRTTNLAAREKEHARRVGYGRGRLAWLDELAAAGLRPRARQLSVERGVAAAIEGEQRWVDIGRRAGWPLVNRPGSARGGVWSLGLRSWNESWQPRHFERELAADMVERRRTPREIHEAALLEAELRRLRALSAECADPHSVEAR